MVQLLLLAEDFVSEPSFGSIASFSNELFGINTDRLEYLLNSLEFPLQAAYQPQLYDEIILLFFSHDSDVSKSVTISLRTSHGIQHFLNRFIYIDIGISHDMFCNTKLFFMNHKRQTEHCNFLLL